jgi:hypothetical protein
MSKCSYVYEYLRLYCVSQKKIFTLTRSMFTIVKKQTKPLEMQLFGAFVGHPEGKYSYTQSKSELNCQYPTRNIINLDKGSC